MTNQESTLLFIGIVCLIAAIVGGNLKLPGAQFGPLENPGLRLSLAAVGVVIIIGSFIIPYATNKDLTKETYLKGLDSLCSELQVSLNRINAKANPSLESSSGRADLKALTNIFREFSANWRRRAVPIGDERIIATAQDLFDEFVQHYDYVIFTSAELERTGRVAEIEKLFLLTWRPEYYRRSEKYNRAIIAYGSNRCSLV